MDNLQQLETLSSTSSYMYVRSLNLLAYIATHLCKHSTFFHFEFMQMMCDVYVRM